MLKLSPFIVPQAVIAIYNICIIRQLKSFGKLNKPINIIILFTKFLNNSIKKIKKRLDQTKRLFILIYGGNQVDPVCPYAS